MQLIYATGLPRRMAFGVATAHTSLPPGAVVYAICDGASLVERCDELTYSAMSNLEYLKFKQMVNDAWQHELKRTRRQAPEGAFDKFLAWLSGQTDAVYRQDVQAY